MAAPTEEEINRIVDGKNHASDAADYAATVVCDVQLISDENYRMIWTNAYNGNFVPNV